MTDRIWADELAPALTDEQIERLRKWRTEIHGEWTPPPPPAARTIDEMIGTPLAAVVIQHVEGKPVAWSASPVDSVGKAWTQIHDGYRPLRSGAET